MSSISESDSDKILFQKDVVGRGNEVVDDAEFVKMYDRSTSKSLNKSYISGINDYSQSTRDHVIQKWNVGDQCMALYEADGKWYPAKIEQISTGKKTCTVSYVGYDQKAVLKVEDLLAEAHFGACYSQFHHQSTDLNWSHYFQTFQSLSHFEQMPPTKRRRMSIKQPIVSYNEQLKVSANRSDLSVELGGFFKVPDIPQHILEGKRRLFWEQRKQQSNHFVGKSPHNNAHSPDNFPYLRFLFRTVPRMPSIGQLQLNALHERSTVIVQRFFASAGPFGTASTDVANFLLEMKQKLYVVSELNLASDHSKISKFATENCATVNLYLEGIRKRLKLEIESDVEAADDVTEHEAEGTNEATKNTDTERKDAFPIPDLCPPPPPSMFGKIAVASNEKEALTNMLMSWYMSGYHTGFYQGVMHEKMSHQKPK